MAKKKNDNALTAAPASDDFEVLPPRPIKKAIGDPFAPAFDPELIEQAEAALEKLSVEFSSWLSEEVTRLNKTFKDTVKDGLHAGLLRDAFYRSAHDLRGQAATFGFPLVAQIAASICHILENMSDEEAAPEQVLRHHVDAIAAIVREGVTNDNDITGQLLARELRKIGDDFAAAQSAKNPESDADATVKDAS